MKNEKGRTMNEMLAVLAIVGMLSVAGIFCYSHVIRQKNVDTILETLRQKTIEINSAMVNNKITDADKLNEFLKKFETEIGSYKLSFRAAPEMDGSFVSDVTYKDGSRIKGSFCRELIGKMSEQTFVSDVDFTLKDELQEDGTTQNITVPLNGKVINLDDVCGG